MHQADYRREYEQYRRDNIKAITIDLRPYAGLFYIEQQHFLLEASDGLYLKGSALPLIENTSKYTDGFGKYIDIFELIDKPQDVYLAGKKVLDISIFGKKKELLLSEQDLKYISAIKLMAKHVIDYFKGRTKVTINKDKLDLKTILNEGGLMCYTDQTLSEYFIKLEHQIELFIENAYYNTYRLDITGSCLSIIKDMDLRIEEWYQQKIAEDD